MPWFLNPTVYAGLPPLQNPEFYYFVAKVLLTLAFAHLLLRRGIRNWRLAGAAWSFFFGMFVAFMLSMHAGVILGLRLLDRPAGTPFGYDFHLFSLLLLSAVLVPQGVRCLRSAAGLAAGEAQAWGRTMRATLWVLGVGVALIPVQFFGLVLTALSLVNLALLAATRPAQGTVERPRELVGPEPLHGLHAA